MSVSPPKEKHKTWLTTLEFQWYTPKRETAGEHDDHDIILYHLQGLKLLTWQLIGSIAQILQLHQMAFLSPSI